MTLEEAEKIAKIISTADGGCSNCVIEMTEEWNKVFPEYKMTCTKEVWEHHYLDWGR
jgi:hypothetical protein